MTFFDAAQHTGAWVGLDFREPVAISRIVYTPRGDGNDVTPGHTHELLYWHDNNWVSLGRREASDIKLVYENAPVNVIFRIRNHAVGKEERIFSYDNDTQIWW